MPLLLANFIYSRDCKLNLRKNVDTTLFGKRRAVRRRADPPEAATKWHPPGQKAHPADDERHGTDQL